MTDDTRPSISPGVTACRSVVVLIVQSSGPAPIKKKLSAASPGDGIQIVSTITSAEASPASGPITTTLPNGNNREMRGASSAATTIPIPNVPSVTPTPEADS